MNKKDLQKVIVTTSIFEPSEAVRRFDRMEGWTLVVIGDQRTPDYHLDNGIYVSPAEQEKYDKRLSDLIGFNSIKRRNFGFLWAKDMGADIIATVDDDNIPMDNWGQDLLVGAEADVTVYEPEAECFDPLSVTNYPHLWHRGFPIQLLRQRGTRSASVQKVHVDIQADLWNGDPDIDAICRMEHGPECTFAPDPFPLMSSTRAPFNSQNTLLSADVLPYYFVLPHVGRMDDIWAAYHVQHHGFKPVFCRASVYQARNKHDLTRDMVDELLGYEKSIDLVRAMAAGSYRPEDFWPKRTCEAYARYRSHFE